MKNFEKKFKEKAGLTWADRLNDPKPGKYAFVERSYLPDSEDDEPQAKEGAAASERRNRSVSPPKCTLAPPVKSLMELIFNESYFDAAMVNLNYDLNKLPLGKLSKSTITRGFQALKTLSECLNNPSRAGECEQYSDLYYSLIPHAFGRNRPPVIRSTDLLKREIELLENLSDLKAADDILKAEDEDGAEQIHQLDFRFRSLGLQEMTALTPDSKEYSEINQYLTKTCGETHTHVSYQVQDIFRIERQGELDQFENSCFSKISSDRRLLWHGSRATNYGGILSQGLRIAPPEAPVGHCPADSLALSVADVLCETTGLWLYVREGRVSRGYEQQERQLLRALHQQWRRPPPPVSGPDGRGSAPDTLTDQPTLQSRCEAELGDPMQVLTEADYDAGEKAKAKGLWSTHGVGMTAPKGWKDASAIHPSLAGVRMVRSVPVDRTRTGRSFC